MRESQRLEALADRLLESDHVDWAAELERGNEDEREMILALRDIARVAEVSRTFEELDVSQRPTGERAFGIAPKGFPERWGHLEIIEKVGAGASATVFRARDPHLNRDAALKLFHFGRPASPEIKRALMEEGRNLAQVKHNNVVTVYGADEQEGRVALWMEFVQGQTLHDLVASQGTMSAEEATAIGVELCRALAAVHAKELVHGDIKAQNVMREAGGRIVLMDFSTSRAAQATADPSKAKFIGTPLYMAPELFRGEGVSVQSDVYSLGVLLFYLVTGKYPVKADTAEKLREAHERGEQLLLSDLRPDLPDDFTGAVEKALSRNPSERFQSAGALKAALAKGIEPVKVAPSVLKKVVTWVGILGGVAASLGFLGFWTSLNFNVALHIPPEFVFDATLDYFIWGVRSMIPAGYYMWGVIKPAIILMASVILFLVLSGRWKLRDVTRQLARQRKRVLDPLDPIAIAAGFFLICVGLIVALSWAFQDVIDAMDRMYAASSMKDVDVAILGPDLAGYTILRKRLYSILILVLAVAAAIVLPYLRNRMGPGVVRLMKATTVVMILVAAVFMVTPYRLLWHNESELVAFEGRKAFIIARNPPDLFLYIPTAPEESHVVVNENDPRIERGPDRVMADIFEE